MGKTILISGGIRSGKTKFALNYCKNINNSLNSYYIATSPRLDKEMEKRIKRHRAERKLYYKNLLTIEEEIDLKNVISSHIPANFLVDSITLWINNLMYHYPDIQYKEIKKQLKELLQHCNINSGYNIFIVDEVGFSLVAENPLARKFQDWLGWTSQYIAENSHEVYICYAGIPINIKKIE